MLRFRHISVPCFLVLAACTATPRPARAPAPQQAVPAAAPDAGRRVVAQNGAVSSANPLASEAGVAMLRAGGNAVDAAVATAFAIGVVEPQMSGLGGSGSALVWLEAEERPYYLDFYASQNADSFRGHTDGPYEPGDLREVGIPGNVAGLLALHERWGVLPRARVLQPAIRLAEQGFPIGQILAGMIAGDSAEMRLFPETWQRYWPGGEPLEAGMLFRNPELARTLRRIAADGADGFYTGPVAEQVVATLNAGGHPATLADLAGYRTRWMRPLCTAYQGSAVLSAPPPQTGLQVLHTLELLEPFDLPALGLPTRSAEAFDAIASALRVATTARRANADPDWVAVPAAGIASDAFARSRASLIGTGHADAEIVAADASPFDAAPPPAVCAPYDPYGPAQPIAAQTEGTESAARPAPARALARADAADAAADGSAGSGEASHASGVDPSGRAAAGARDDAGEASYASASGVGRSGRAAVDAQHGTGETTHISVVDRDGNAVALTQTNSSLFGSGAWVAGFFLNDSGYRFTDRTIDSPSRRRWRTRTSTIAPTIVLDDGDVRMVIGAPGGGRIPTAIAQVMVYTLDFGMDPLDAVRMPRMFPAADEPTVQLEHGYSAAVLHDVRGMGYRPASSGFGYARLYVIVRQDGRWIAVADPRHDGEARGY